MRLAKLWLTPVTDDIGARNSNADELMLVPGLFYGSVKVDGHHKPSDSQWLIAYPYRPQVKDSHSWRTPIDVWGSAACEFLTALGDGSTTEKKFFEITLRWEQDLFLLPQPDEKEILDNVYIEETPPQQLLYT